THSAALARPAAGGHRVDGARLDRQAGLEQHVAAAGRLHLDRVGAGVDLGVVGGRGELRPLEQRGPALNGHVDGRDLGGGVDDPDLGLARGRGAEVVAEDLPLDVGKGADGGHRVGVARLDVGRGLDHRVGGGGRPGRADGQVVGPGGQLQVLGDGLVLDPGQHLVVVDVHVNGGGVGGEVGDPDHGGRGLGAGGGRGGGGG